MCKFTVKLWPQFIYKIRNLQIRNLQIRNLQNPQIFMEEAPSRGRTNLVTVKRSAWVWSCPHIGKYLAKFIFLWTNFHGSKWPKTKQIIQLSGHTGYGALSQLSRPMVQLPNPTYLPIRLLLMETIEKPNYELFPTHQRSLLLFKDSRQSCPYKARSFEIFVFVKCDR